MLLTAPPWCSLLLPTPGAPGAPGAPGGCVRGGVPLCTAWAPVTVPVESRRYLRRLRTWGVWAPWGTGLRALG